MAQWLNGSVAQWLSHEALGLNGSMAKLNGLDSEALWTVDCQVPLPMEFSRQEHWSGLPFPPSGDLLVPEIQPTSLASPALAGKFFSISITWEAPLLL